MLRQAARARVKPGCLASTGMVQESREDVTGLLVEWSNGDEQALARLMPLVYDELHRLAGGYLRRERADRTLQTTALVHEAYMRLIDQKRIQWRGSLHFVALSAQMMRRILIDHARAHGYAKRGGGARKLSLDDAPQISMHRPAELLQLDEALEELARMDPELARIVELRFFGGLKSAEIAELDRCFDSHGDSPPAHGEGLVVSLPEWRRRWTVNASMVARTV